MQVGAGLMAEALMGALMELELAVAMPVVLEVLVESQLERTAQPVE